MRVLSYITQQRTKILAIVSCFNTPFKKKKQKKTKTTMTFRVIFFVFLFICDCGTRCEETWLAVLSVSYNLTFDDSSISKKISTTTKWPPRPLSSWKWEIDNQKSDFFFFFNIWNTIADGCGMILLARCIHKLANYY